MAGKRGPYVPLDLRCPLCSAPAGERCRSMVISGRPILRRPHAERVTAARVADAGRQHPRIPAGVSDAWTCSSCNRSYWPPREWEPELWPRVRELLQVMHGARHRAENAASHPGTAP